MIPAHLDRKYPKRGCIYHRNGTMRVNRKHVSSKAMKFPDLDDPWQYDTRESSEERSH